MAQKELVYKLKFVTENGEVIEKSADNIKDISQSVGQLETKLKGATLGSEEFKGLQTELKKSKGALDEAQASTMSFSEKLQGIPGPVGQAIQGVMGLGKAFMTLIANPIGAAIAAIALIFTTLYKALTSTEEGAFKLKEVMGALSGVLNPVIRLLQEIALVLVDGILKGLELVQRGLSALGFDQFSKASADARDLARAINEVEEAEGDLNVERAKQNKQLAEAREIISDTNKSLGERQEALQKVKKSEEDLAAKETNLAKKRLANIREQIKQQGKSTQLLDEEEQALISLYNTQQNQSAVRRKNIKAEQALLREVAADEKEQDTERQRRSQEAEERRKEKLRKAKEAADFEKNLNIELIENDYDRQIQQLKNQEEAQIEQIKSLNVSALKGQELILKVVEKTQQKIAEIENKRAADQDAKFKADQAKKEADIQSALNRELANINSLIELDKMKYENLAQLSEDDLDNTIRLLNEKMRLEIAMAEKSGASAAQLQLIKATYADAEIQLTKNVTKAKLDAAAQEEQIEREQLRRQADSLGLIAQAAGETTAIGKVAAVAQATINTYLSATEAYKSVAGIPGIGPVLGVAAAGAAIALGLKQVSEIMSVNDNIPKPTFGTGGIVSGMGGITTDNIPAMLSNGESVINARSTAMFRPTLDLMNQLGGGAKFQGGLQQNGVDMAQMELIAGVKSRNQTPVRAYVVASQASNQLQLDRQVKSRSLV